MKTFRRRITATLASLATVLALGGGLAGSAQAVTIPAPNKDTQVAAKATLMDGEGSPCQIVQLLAQGQEESLLFVEPGCGSPTRPLMGIMKLMKNKGKTYSQVAAAEAGQPVPEATTDEVLISYGIKQPVYLKNDREAGIVGYLVFQVPNVGSVVELHAKYVK